MKIQFKYFYIFLMFIALSPAMKAQVSVLEQYISEINSEQDRIDGIDGETDGKVMLKSPIQTEQAGDIYIHNVNRVKDRIIISGIPDPQKLIQLKQLKSILQEVSEKNVHFYTRFGNIFKIIIKIQDTREPKQIEAILNSNVYSSLQIIAFYNDMPLAENFLINAALTEPAELLKHFSEYDYKPYRNKVLKALVSSAPMKVKNYLYSNNIVHRRVRESKDELVKTFYAISREQSSATRAYILLPDIADNKISIAKADKITSTDTGLFNYLIKMRVGDDLIGLHSIDEALTYQCLKKIRLINELHNESDAVRFRSTNAMDAYEMYTLMVYAEEEIFTSTFLGMYKRMMAKMTETGTHEFLHNMNFLKFRTFIKMCAGFNVLPDFLGKMSDFEKQMLFKRMVDGIENTQNKLESAVTIADTYGSMHSLENKMLLEESIVKYYTSIRYSDPQAEKLYGLLLNILNIGQGVVGTDTSFSTQQIMLTVLPFDRVFKDGKNIQQHFFFNDPDGKTSYYSFVATFNSGNWKVIDKGSYVLIKSVYGKPVEIYANKPERDFEGQKAIHNYFTETRRWPDVVVLRGHSYYASTAIESLTPNAEIVFLGSCGGYNNINQVLNYSPQAQIISSKQIGTTEVNNRLCYQLNETIRKGEDLIWENLWKKLDRSFANGSTADNRFEDYIPPHKNLGALLIKTYRSML